MKPIKFLLVSSLTAWSFSCAFGEVFLNVNASYDLSDIEAWGGTFPTGTVRIDSAGVYSCNAQDMTFKSIQANAKNIVITNNPGRTISLTGNGGYILYPYNAGVTLEFRGGVYDFRGNTTQIGDVGKTRFTLSGGVNIVNAGSLNGRHGGSAGDHALIVTNAGTQIHTKSFSSSYKGGEPVAYVPGCDPSAAGVVVDVSTGAKIAVNESNDGGSFGNSAGWMLVRGEGTEVTVNAGNCNFGGASNTGGVHVTDFAVFDHKTGNTIFKNNCITGGVQVVADNHGEISLATCYLGSWTAGNFDNAIVAGADGKVTMKSVWANGSDNRLVCSNGTMRAEGNIQLEASDTDKGVGIVIDGDKPHLTCGGEMILNGTFLEWRLPRSGYTVSGALVSAGSFTVGGGGVKFVITGAEALQRNLKEKTEITLAEAISDSGSVPSSQTALDAVNATLPVGCKVYRSDDKKRLVLSMKPIKGIVINVK